MMDLPHVKLRLLPRPAEYLLEYVRHVVHEIDRVVPTNNKIARFEIGLGLGIRFRIWQDNRLIRVRHGQNVDSNNQIVE